MRLTRKTMILAVVGAALLAYVNTLWNGFAYDDNWIILRNPHVHSLADLRSIWLTPYWPNYGSELGLYRPFTIFAFALQWSIVGETPWFFHLISITAHAGCSVLVFLLIARLFDVRAAFAGALLFAVHPLHTEAVANVVGQAELWVTLTALAACVIYTSRPQPGAAVSPRRAAAILALYAIGLLAKESAVVLPGLLMLLDFVQRRVGLDRAGLRKYAGEVAFLFLMLSAVLLAYLTLRLDVLGNIAGTDAAPGLPFLREEYRLLNALRAWPEFVRLLFFPLDLSADYSPAVILPVESVTPMVLLGLLLVAVTVILMLATPWRPAAGLVAGWFFLALLPVSNFLFPIGVLIAERTLYLPSVAVCFIAGLAWQHAARSTVRETRRLAWAVGIVIMAGFTARTMARNPDWDSLAAVWHGLQRDHPEAYRSQWVKASEMWLVGNPKLAEQYFFIANRIWPRDSQLLNDMGNFYIAQRNYLVAVPYLERSRAMTPFVVHTYESLAYAYLYADRPAEALRTALRALELGGGQRALMYAVAGGAYERLGRWNEAAGAWRAAAKSRNGGIWLYWAMQARALASGGHVNEALRAADVAAARTGGQPALLQVVDRLKAGISAGCYPAGRDCDALEGWIIAVAQPGSALANGNPAAKRNDGTVIGPGPEADPETDI